MRKTTRFVLATASAAVLAVTTAAPALADAVPTGHGHGHGHDTSETRTLERYAADTWASLVAMTDPDTGLPSDNIDGALQSAGAPTPRRRTSAAICGRR
ncbi:hypothetical protein QE374_002505 [Microbacterium sp. SORGH_AS428]|nr:hypothetical protein [Microbacterium sp. SORGH_AS_0428]MDR6200596.1 hypothetical protein [Microbacterium sp. SORGH_AS_0428]